MLKASEDKTFPGAIVASLASPWGQAVSAGDPANTYFGSYREVFARDLYEAWTGLVADGDLATARDATLFLFERQQLPDGSMPRNSLVNGKTAPDSFGTQLDETAYPILMAQQLGLTDASLYTNHIKPAANFLVAHGPSFGVERWEEQSGYSPSTIAAEIAGLVAAADLARGERRHGLGRDLARRRRRLAALDQGLDGDDERAAGRHPYFIRLSKTGDPNAADLVQRRQRRPDARPARGHRRRLPRARAARRAAGERPRRRSSRCRSSTRRSGRRRRAGRAGTATTATATATARATDGRGRRAARAPATSGRSLSAERGEQLARDRRRRRRGVAAPGHERASPPASASIPEQDWELPDLAASPFGTDPTLASIGFDERRRGRLGIARSRGRRRRSCGSRPISPPGATSPCPAVTNARYVAHTQGTTTLTVTSPADNSSVAGSPVTVTGTTAAGNTVYVVGDEHRQQHGDDAGLGHGRRRRLVQRRRHGHRRDDASSTSSPCSPTGGTAHVKRTVVFDFVPGTLLLDVTDPDNDDNGPGNYAYPTSGDFHAGAFDIQRFQVYDAGTDVIFRLQTRDLTPTFGSPLGAQLVDVYVHVPGRGHHLDRGREPDRATSRSRRRSPGAG